MTTRSLLCLLLLLPAPARSEAVVSGEKHAGSELSLVGSVGTAAGHDSDLRLESGLLPADGVAEGGGLVQLTPEIGLQIASAGGHGLELAYGMLLRQYFLGNSSEDTLVDHGLGAIYRSPPLAGFRLEAGLALHHFFLNRSQELNWLALAAQLGVRRALGQALRLGLGYELNQTFYLGETNASWDMTHQLWLQLTWRVAQGLTVTPEYSALLLGPDSAERTLQRHAPGLSLSWQMPWLPLTVDTGYSFDIINFKGESYWVNPAGKPVTEELQRQDLVHQLFVELRYDLSLRWSFFVRHDTLLGSSDQADDYRRHLTMAGVTLRAFWQRQRPRLVRTAAPRDHGPAARPHLRLALDLGPDIRRVSLVGSFNGWDPGQTPLRYREGRWRVELPLPPGRHTFSLWVDGTVRPPPGCATMVSDGFGGHNCLVEIPGASSAPAEIHSGDSPPVTGAATYR